MAERVVKVRLSAAVEEYKKGMLEAAQATRSVGTEGDKLKQTREAFEAVGRGAMVMGGLIGAGVTVAVAKFAEFDAAMSNVQAATGETASNMDLLRTAAIDAGASTVFSATEAANAIEELSKAGVSTADILSGALAGSLDLAAAGQLGVARAAEITSTAMNQFRLSGDQASHVADVLAAGAGKAMGSVDDLANGLKFVGPVAAAMGVSLEETTGALALFAQQGIIGEQAGTSLRGVLSSLTSPSKEARGEIERLGITLYDSQGRFLGLENAAGQLSTAYRNMDDASRDASLGTIFGRETVTAATALYQAGAEGVDQWTQAVDDSGYAAEQARTRLDNLKGDIEALQGAMDSALIQTGSAANDSLRYLTQAVTGLVGAYGDLPEPVQQATLIVGGATAAVALAGGTALNVVPKFLELQSTVRGAGLSMGGLSLAAGGAGLALGGLFAIVGELARRHTEAQANARAYADTLEEGTNRVTSASRDLAEENLAMEQSWLFISRGSAYDAAEKLGLSLETVTDAATGNVAALKELEDVIRAGSGEQEAAQRIADELGLSLTDVSAASTLLTESVLGENQSIEDAIRVNEQKARATQEVAESSEEASGAAMTLSESYNAEAEAVSSVADELSRLIETVNEANGVGQDAISANIDYQNALAKVDETIAKARDGAEGYIATLDTNTQAGRNNKDMLVDLAQQAQNAAEKQFNLDGNTDAYRATLEGSRQALIDRATQLGMNADEAGALADQIFRIPSETEWAVIAETAAAGTKLQSFFNAWTGRRINVGVDVTGGAKYTIAGTGVTFNARGGLYDYAAFADGGGVATGIYNGRQGAIHKFAEPETVWEAFISGKPDERNRNIGIWQETGRRLGVDAGAAAVSFPETVTLVDKDGSILAHARAIANQQIHAADEKATQTVRRGRNNR
ncbi:phage tail tape measure protein [Microbacterium sp. HMH0099]|uniref:phage tail tape measure protein n=1 Tax=Microbacterium sp. HMH0099 TaxID=3414026 RepID=UPI003BF6290F